MIPHCPQLGLSTYSLLSFLTKPTSGCQKVTGLVGIGIVFPLFPLSQDQINVPGESGPPAKSVKSWGEMDRWWFFSLSSSLWRYSLFVVPCSLLDAQPPSEHSAALQDGGTTIESKAEQGWSALLDSLWLYRKSVQPEWYKPESSLFVGVFTLLNTN